MAYTKQTWKDHVTSRPHTYNETVNQDGTKTLEAAGEVLQQGSPMSAERFSHMEQGIADAHSAVSDLEAATETALLGKVDKETGKGLSTNDYTTAEKNKLAGLSNYDDTAVNSAMVRADAPDEEGFSQLYKMVNGVRTNVKPKGATITIDDDFSDTSENAVQNKVVTNAIENIKNLVYPKITITGYANTKITLTSGSKVLEATPDSTGVVTVAVPLLGTWDISTVYSGTTYERTVLCDTIGGSYAVKLPIAVYGVSWGGSSSTSMTRTGDAAGFSDPVPALGGGSGSSPFDSCYPWSEMERVTIDGNELVKIPKFWYKITKTGNTMKFEIAESAKDGFLVSPAHADRGDGKGERDYVYIARYKCSSSNWKSVSGALPKVNVTRSEMRTGITGLGAGYYMQDFAMFWTTRLLYIVEYADWNSQAKIGYGCGNNSSVQNTGASDGMSYHTGTMQSSRTTYGVGVQYRYIEDPWGNVFEWCDGIRFSSTTVYAYKKPSEYSDSTGGTSVGTRPSSSNYISAWSIPSVSGYEWALYPSAVSDSYSTYVADYCYYSSSGVVLCVGGNYYQSQGYGLFCLLGDYDAASKRGDVGGRLQYLPQ